MYQKNIIDLLDLIHHWYFVIRLSFIFLANPFDFRCELDEYGELVNELRDSGIVKEHKKNLKTYKNSFIGKEAVDWLSINKNLGKLYYYLFYVQGFFLNKCDY